MFVLTDFMKFGPCNNDDEVHTSSQQQHVLLISTQSISLNRMVYSNDLLASVANQSEGRVHCTFRDVSSVPGFNATSFGGLTTTEKKIQHTIGEKKIVLTKDYSHMTL